LDAANEVRPSQVDGVANPFHVVAIVAMGMWLIDNAAMGAIAATCSELRRYEFLSLIIPLALCNATGSPVNPVAVF